MRNVENIGRWAVRMLQCALVADVVFAANTVVSLYYWHYDGLDAYAEALDLVEFLVSFGCLLVLFVCYFICGRWIYLVTCNAAQISPQNERIKPGWAVGWHFIPLFSFWKPFVAIRQTWNTTFKPTEDMDAAAPSLLKWWWAGWLLSTIIAHYSFKVWQQDTVESLIVSHWSDLVNFPCSMLATYLFLQIVRQVTSGQAREEIQELFAEV